jgi:hypothetical protein
MATHHEELANAGALLEAAFLLPSSKGGRIEYSVGKRTVMDGPFAETKELIARHTLIRVQSREEAVNWTRCFSNLQGEGADAAIEVRPLSELEDFGPSKAVECFRDLESSKKE